jgi:large subunit ribosomal protein L24
MTVSSQGRSASALAGALSGNGTVTLESADIAGLDPRAFDTAIRASDSGEATDDATLRQIVEPVLSAGALSVKSAQIPFNIRDGRLRVGATALDAKDARAIVSGGYDIPADQADFRAVLASTATGQGTSRPEIQLFAAGSPDALARTVDIGALSSWLAVRAIDRETRRLDSIERGDPVQAFPASIPPAAAVQPLLRTPDAATSEQPLSEAPVQHRPAPKPRVSAPRPPGSPDPNAPVVSQHVAPLPPTIEVRPAPRVARSPKLTPRPPLMLVPPLFEQPRPGF